MNNIDRSGQLVEIVKKRDLQMEILPLDITSEASVRHTIDKIVKESRKIDVLDNNAGYAERQYGMSSSYKKENERRGNGLLSFVSGT